MWIVDGHLDLAWCALQWNRDLTMTVSQLRAQPYTEVPLVARQSERGDIVPTLSLPEMRKGRVGLCFATLLARSTGSPVPHTDFASPLQAHAVATGQLAYYRALEAAGELRMIRDLAALDGHAAMWEAADVDAAVSPPLGIVLAAEGVDFILEPDRLDEWHAAGLRLLSLSHFGPGRYAGGTGCGEGLSPRGVALLAGMRRLKMIIDVSHLSDPAFREVLDRWDGPVLASHNNCRALVPGLRQFSDDQVRELVRRDAVIGSVFDAWMLVPGYVRQGANNPKVTMEAVADHIDHVCQVAGDARHAAIGSDLDGAFGKEQTPADLDTIADVQKLGGILRRRGHSDADVALIFNGNWLRLLRRAWAG